MITRLVVVDPNPDTSRPTDVLVYQVPERSRELALLLEAFQCLGLEMIEVPTAKRAGRKAQGACLLCGQRIPSHLPSCVCYVAPAVE